MALKLEADDLRLNGQQYPAKRIRQVADLAAARALALTDEETVMVPGKGLYRYDVSSALAADGFLVMAPEDGVGRLIHMSRDEMLNGQALDVRAFGAVGDGVANDAPAIRAAIAALPKTGGTLRFPPGTYLQGAAGTPSGTDLRFLFDGYNNVRVQGDGARITAHPALPPEPGFGGFTFVRCKNVVVEGLTYDGRLDTRAALGSDPAGTNWQHGFTVGSGCEQVVLRNCRAERCMMDGFYVGADGAFTPDLTTAQIAVPRAVQLVNCVSLYSYRQGLSVVGVNGLSVEGGSYSQTATLKGTAPMSGIDCEGWSPNGWYNLGVTIRGITASGNAGSGIVLHEGTTGALVEGCIVEGNAAYGICTSNAGAPATDCTIRGNRIAYNGQAPSLERMNIIAEGPGHVIEANTIVCKGAQQYAIWAHSAVRAGRNRVIRANTILCEETQAGVWSGAVMIFGDGDQFVDNVVQDVWGGWGGAGGPAVVADAPNSYIARNVIRNTRAGNAAKGLQIRQCLRAEGNDVSGWVSAPGSPSGGQIEVFQAQYGGAAREVRANRDADNLRLSAGHTPAKSWGLPEEAPVWHDGRAIFYADSNPGDATGAGVRAWVRGDLALQSSPTDGYAVGWLCVLGGSPGTWVQVGVAMDGQLHLRTRAGSNRDQMLSWAEGDVMKWWLTRSHVDGYLRLTNVATGHHLMRFTTDDQIVFEAAAKLGFFGAAPADRPTVAGSRGGNAALASLLSALATLGLIVNNTTA